MGLEEADHDVAPRFLLGMAVEQHPERLPDAGCHTQKHAQVTTTRTH
jgi:hypothetical protein